MDSPTKPPPTLSKVVLRSPDSLKTICARTIVKRLLSADPHGVEQNGLRAVVDELPVSVRMLDGSLCSITLGRQASGELVESLLAEKQTMDIAILTAILQRLTVIEQNQNAIGRYLVTNDFSALARTQLANELRIGVPAQPPPPPPVLPPIVFQNPQALPAPPPPPPPPVLPQIVFQNPNPQALPALRPLPPNVLRNAEMAYQEFAAVQRNAAARLHNVNDTPTDGVLRPMFRDLPIEQKKYWDDSAQGLFR